MLNMASTNAFPEGIAGGICGTSWKGHDWDINVRELKFPYHSAMCLPSALMVWRSLVGGNQWETTSSDAVAKWLKKDYASLLSKTARDEVQEKKQKTRQRLFYSRIQDYMDAAYTHLMGGQRRLQPVKVNNMHSGNSGKNGVLIRYTC
jgi:hypothetical protein